MKVLGGIQTRKCGAGGKWFDFNSHNHSVMDTHTVVFNILFVSE
jgi:hypothetical protein